MNTIQKENSFAISRFKIDYIYHEDIVNIKFHGACIGCNVNQMTLTNGVEATIKKYVPQIKKVVEVK